MRKFEGMKKVLSVLLALSMVLSYVPMPALAAEDGICAHHKEHDDSCGYAEAQSCGHVCTEECQREEVVSCQHTCTEDTCTWVDAVDAVSCGHVCGDGSCSYVPATDEAEEVPCDYHSETCGCQSAVEAHWDCTHECTVDTGCVTYRCLTHVCPEGDCGYAEAGQCTYALNGCADCEEEAEDTPDVPQVKTVSAWSWNDEWEVLSDDGTYATFLQTDWATLTGYLPQSITATVDGEEGVTLAIIWECEAFPAEGEAQGTYELKAILPEGYALGEETAALELEVDVGEIEQYADEDTWDGTTATQAWASGNGTQDDAYVIMTAEQLAKLAADVNNGTNYADTYFKLGADLDLNGSSYNWTPIGGYHSNGQSSGAKANAFAGVFDGDNHIISNMHSDGPTKNYDYAGYRGLFGNLGGTLKNLTLNAPQVSGRQNYFGAAVAYADGATISGITVNNPNFAHTDSAKYNGGVVGYMANGTIVDCKVIGGNVTASSVSDSLGGIVGYATDVEISGCSVKNVTISSSSQYVGGIVGQLQYTDGTNSITNCAMENTAITSTSSVVGGIVGFAYGNSAGRITVKLCSVTGGSVTASYYVGGIMGQSYYVDIIGCCNYGSPVTATSSTGYAGGILGYSSSGNCYSCFSSAVITASKYSGAIISKNSSYYYECAYDKTLYTTDLTYSNTKGFTTEEIKKGLAAWHLANTGTRTQNYHDWGQKLGTDLYPVWNTENDNSIVVLREETSSGYLYYNEGGLNSDQIFMPNASGIYEIANTEHWYKFVLKAKEDPTVNAIVTDNIDFSAISADKIGDYRIGVGYEYTGTFNGNSKTVSGLPTTDAPLFGTIGANGKLQNLTVSGATLTSKSSTAGLVMTNKGTVEGCAVINVAVSGISGAAGIVYKNEGGTVENCKVESGTVTGSNDDTWVGGICAFSTQGSFSGCSNNAEIKAEGTRYVSAAGIVAAPQNTATVEITNCFNTGDISSSIYAGGITAVYYPSYGSCVNISLCYNTGAITGSIAGGIAAYGSFDSTDKIINCYNAGTVKATSKAGGIAGEQGNVIIENCHNYAAIVSDNIGAPIVGYSAGVWPGPDELINNHAIEGNVTAPHVSSYLDTKGATTNFDAVTVGSTRKEFANGTITALLNAGNTETVWYQYVDYPILEKKSIPVTGVELSEETLSLQIGGMATLTATVLPTNATNKNVIWSSNNTAVATVEDGVITAIGSGTATITVTTEEGGFTDTCVVTVHSHNWTYTASASVEGGANDTITATCGNASTCPNSTQTITIAASGKIYDGNPVKATLTGSIDGVIISDDDIIYSGNTDVGTYTASITIDSAKAEAEFTIGKATPTITWDSESQTVTYTSEVAEIDAPTVTLVNGETFSGTINYSYTGTSGGKEVSGTGLPTNAGTYTITASVEAQGNYAAATASTTLTIEKQKITIPNMTWEVPQDVVYTGYEYTATLTGALPNGVEATLSGNKGTDAGTYTAKAVFSLADGFSADNYEIENGEDLTADWTIAKKNIAGAQITLGTALTYNGEQQTQAVTKVEIDGLTVTYTVSDNTGTDAKGYTLTVTGNGNFEGTETADWSIAKAKLTITVADQILPSENSKIDGSKYTVTGLVDGHKVDGVKLGIVDGDGGEKYITVAENDRAAITIEDKDGNNFTSNYQIEKVVNGKLSYHAHVWGYSANEENNTITATCSGIGECPVTDRTVTITLNAPTDLTYDGTEKVVTVTQSPADVFTDVPAVTYEGNRIDAGNHTASLTYGGVTATLDFTVDKAYINNVSVDVTAPEAGATPQATVTAGTDYTAEIEWTPSAETFGFNTAYTATVTLTADGNHKFADNLTVGGWEVSVTEDGSAATLTKAFDKTRKEKLTEVSAPEDQTLSEYHTNAADAMEELPTTVTYTTESGSVTVDIEWTCESYNSATKATNTFEWSVKDGELANYEQNNVVTSGTITVTNVAALPVTNTGSDDEITYSDSTYDVSEMFTPGENAGEASYAIVEGGTGEGTLDGSTLTITKAGTIIVKMTTEANGAYAPGDATATLTVKPVSDKVTVTITENSGTEEYDGTGKTVTGYTVSIDNELYTEADFTFNGDATVKGTDAGTYQMELKPEDFGNDSSNFSNVEFVIVDGTLEISKRTITITGATLKSKTYNGTAEAEVTALSFDGLQNGESLTLGTDYTVVAAFNSADAGTANKTVTITVTLKDTDVAKNYTMVNSTFTMENQTIAKAKPTVTAPAGKTGLTYTGSAQTLADAGSTTGGEMQYSLNGTDWGTEIPTGTNAGSYTVHYKVVGNDNYENAAAATITVTIAPKEVAPTVTLSDDTFTANGTAYEPTVTVKDGDTIIDSGEYTASYAGNVAVGKATVTISDVYGGNYTITGTSASFLILPDTTELDKLDAATVTSDDEDTILDVVNTMNLTEEDLADVSKEASDAWNAITEQCETLLNAIEDAEQAADAVDKKAEELADRQPTTDDLDVLEKILDDYEAAEDNMTDAEKEAVAEDVAALKEIVEDLKETEQTLEDIDQAIEDLEKKDLTFEDKDNIQDILEEIEDVLENDDNLSESDKAALEEDKQRAEDLLDEFAEAEEAEEAIEELLDDLTYNVQPDDKDAIDAYTEAMKIYEDLEDDQNKVNPTVVKKLESLNDALTAYKITKGSGAKWYKGSKKDLSFTANGYHEKCIGVKIDGELIDESNYSISKGSTIVTLKASYLQSLKTDKYTIRVVYSDGETDDGEFTVLWPHTDNPRTGDYIMMAVAVMALSAAALAILLIVKKKKAK